jgi:hypothetical protein
MILPILVDWPKVFRNIEDRAGLRPSAVGRVAKVDRGICHRLLHEPGVQPAYRNAAPILNLHMALLPDVPIPARVAEALS